MLSKSRYDRNISVSIHPQEGSYHGYELLNY